MADYYAKGQLVRITATYTDKATGQAVDPAGVTCKIKKPDATVNTYTYTGAQVVKDATGVYHYDVDANAAGEWAYQWTSTGVNQAAVEGTFEVRASKF